MNNYVVIFQGWFPTIVSETYQTKNLKDAVKLASKSTEDSYSDVYGYDIVAITKV